MSLFERGFKAWCEKYSKEKRGELEIRPSDPLDPFALAKNLGVQVWFPTDIGGLSQESLEVLLQNDGVSPSCWSAVTIVVESLTAVILNSSHSKGRQASDLMHELSHRILNHGTHEIAVSGEGIMLLSAYEKQQEEEADWLSGCLLLPRDALFAIKQQQLEEKDAAAKYGVSVSMMKYRMSMTGINKQFRSSRI